MNLKQISLDSINAMAKNTLMEVLDIQCIEIGKDFIRARMPVDKRTHQPMGLLHGGASAALIESIGSMGSALLIDLTKESCVGLELNCNHVRGVLDGAVIATGKIIHAGRKTHLWQIDIIEETTGKLVCTGRLTVMVIPKDKN
jgi:1,4-dihydroxy-2-naphthoyl-CoA hydrolase